MSQLIFHKEGYITGYGYFTNKIKHKSLIKLYIDKLNVNFKLISEIQDDSLFQPYYVSRIGMSYGKYVADPGYEQTGAGRVYLPESTYNLLFDKSMNRVRGGLKTSHKIKSKNKGWVVYDYLYREYNFDVLNELIDHNKNLLAITHAQLGKSRVNEEFDKVLNKYIGEDVIIPYDLENRKEKFPLAFSELEPYMRKYLSKKSKDNSIKSSKEADYENIKYNQNFDYFQDNEIPEA